MKGETYKLSNGISGNQDKIVRYILSSGVSLCYTTVRYRLKSGDRNLESLRRQPTRTGGPAKLIAMHKAKHDEMAAVIAALDARKRGMK